LMFSHDFFSFLLFLSVGGEVGSPFNSTIDNLISQLPNICLSTNNHPQIIIYNRIGKTGSSSLSYLIKKLSVANKFRYIEPKGPYHDPDIIRKAITEALKRSERAVISNHFNFPNIEDTRIAYINVIRKPFSRISSHYCYSRYLPDKRIRGNIRRYWGTQSFSSCVLNPNWTQCFNHPRSEYIYFCGPEDDPGCTEKVPEWDNLAVKHRLGPEKQVEIAMKHLQEYYFCGITEEFEKSVQLLAILFPDFFQGAPEEFRKLRHINQATKNELTCQELQNATETENVLKEKSPLLQRDQRMYDFAVNQFWGCYEQLKFQIHDSPISPKSKRATNTKFRKKR